MSDVDDETLICPRCHRPTPAQDTALWNERVRLRTFSDGAFRYVHKDHYYAVCRACHDRLKRGGDMADLHQRRGVVILVGAMILAVAAAVATPHVLPKLASAFWQTH